MNNNNAPKQLAAFPVQVNIKLALLWVTLMLLYIYADYFNLMAPGRIKEMMELRTPVGPTTPGVLVAFSILLMVPALMIALSVVLQPVWNKWVNIVAAGFYAIISILIVVSGMGNSWQTFFVLYNVVELFVLAAIIVQAWKWPVVSL